MIRYQRQRPGELVHLDVKHQGRIPDDGGHRTLGRGCGRGGRGHQGLGYEYLHVAVDDCSRVAYVEALADERGDTSATFAAQALAFYGGLGVVVQRVMTDNGAGYRSGAFRRVLERAGSGTCGPGRTGRRPTARWSGSTTPSTWRGLRQRLRRQPGPA